jgi:hypothetical protein
VSHPGANGSNEFSWFWRSGLRYYHRHARIWQKWLHRIVLWWDSVCAEEGVRSVRGFDLYDKETRWDGMRFDRWQQFEELVGFLVAELEQASLGVKQPR